MKDFNDVWALAGLFPFEGRKLQAAVAACFERRGTRLTAEVPRPLTSAFYSMPEIATRWSHYLARGTAVTAPPARFDIVGERIIRFLGPVRSSIVEGSSLEVAWVPGGPWVSPGEETSR
jgi:hypothetical protein